MDNVIIDVFNIVGNSFCVEATDGQKVFEMIAKTFKEKKNVKLSFQNVEMLTSAFLNTAVGQLYRDFPEEEIKMGISVEGMAPEDMALLKRVTDTAKLFYKNPARMEKSINEIMGE
jgi:hypothetical protein